MSNLIERYIYDVIRRLPDKDRAEVGKELNSNISDMLAEDANENEIKNVLYELGSPASLAEQYRRKPRYLISPAMYDDYIRTLKFIIPLVSMVVMIVSLVISTLNALGNETAVIGEIISNGISSGLSAAFQVFAWVTIGFSIADRTKATKAKDWTIEDLPKEQPNDKLTIPYSESITGLVMTVVFSLVMVFVCSGKLPLAYIIKIGEIQVTRLFNPEFLIGCIPGIIVITVFAVFEYIFKIMFRRWTPSVCCAVIVSNLASMSVMIYLINKPNIFSDEFIAFATSREWGSHDILRFVGTNGENQIFLVISLIIAISFLAGCVTAVYKTFSLKIKK